MATRSGWELIQTTIEVLPVPSRNPFHDPMPGDVFRSGNGTVWRIVDEFVSVLRSGEERAGLRALVERNGHSKVAYVGPRYLRRVLKSASLVRKSRRSTLQLARAPRVPHTEDHALLDAAFASRPIEVPSKSSPKARAKAKRSAAPAKPS
jgi:hypothetical protein